MVYPKDVRFDRRAALFQKGAVAFHMKPGPGAAWIFRPFNPCNMILKMAEPPGGGKVL